MINNHTAAVCVCALD